MICNEESRMTEHTCYIEQFPHSLQHQDEPECGPVDITPVHRTRSRTLGPATMKSWWAIIAWSATHACSRATALIACCGRLF